jgi:DDE domain
VLAVRWYLRLVTDQAATYLMVVEELLPAAWHRTEQYANNRVECDHGRLKARLRAMRGLKQDRNAAVILAGHALRSTSWPWRTEPRRRLWLRHALRPGNTTARRKQWHSSKIHVHGWTAFRRGTHRLARRREPDHRAPHQSGPGGQGPGGVHHRTPAVRGPSPATPSAARRWATTAPRSPKMGGSAAGSRPWMAWWTPMR